MSVTDFECAIAKSQIARYISGENLAPEVARQLETHISACPRCKQLLMEKKSSLEAMIEDKTTAEPRTEISVPSNPVPMTKGSLALNIEPARFADIAEPTAAEVEAVKQSLIAKRNKVRLEDSNPMVDVPVVAPAFAHKETLEAEALRLQLAEAAKPKKKRFSLESLALYKRIPDQEEQPTMSVENLRTAKEVLKTQKSSLKKPMMYLCGVCAVMAAMSFFVKDPTALFGGKAEAQNLLVSDKNPKEEAAPKKNNKLSKAPAKHLSVVGNGTNAQAFKPVAPNKPIATAVKTPAISTATATEDDLGLEAEIEASEKPTVKPKAAPKPKSRSTVKPKTTKPTAHVAKAPVKAAHKPTVKRRKSKSSTPKGNVVKLYTPENTPVKEQN